jgi:hypothetical protein
MKANLLRAPLIAISILIGCAQQPNYIEEPVTNHNRRYVIDRFSFLPPAGAGFAAIIHNDKTGVDFEFCHETQGYNGRIWVGATTSYTGYTAQDIADKIQDEYDHRVEKYLLHLNEYNKNVDDIREAYLARVNSVPKPSTHIVEVAGLTCAKSIDYIRELTPVAEYRTPTDGGISRWIRYFCPIRSQSDKGPIVVNFHLTAAPGRPMLDMEEILEPLLDSIEITHNPGSAVSQK